VRVPAGILVNLGGWRVGIADDAGFDTSTDSIEPRQVVMIRDGGLATSSPLGRTWRRDGAELHHIIDPSVPAGGP
jgi:thiamine biosynthesis lipoprotein